MNTTGQSGAANGSGHAIVGKTIDLQGVAAFASLVEMLAQELGTSPGNMRGQLPNGPASFDKLMGELDVNSQGFLRKLILVTQPGAPLTLRFQCNWAKNPDEPTSEILGGITADYYLGVTVEEIIPQGRALARYVEDVFSVMDRMVTLGHSQRLSGMTVPRSKLEAFERSEAESLITQYDPTAKEE